MRYSIFCQNKANKLVYTVPFFIFALVASQNDYFATQYKYIIPLFHPSVNGKINASRSGVIFCSKNMTGDATERNTAAYIMDFPYLPGFLPPVWKSLGTGNTLPY